MPLGTPAPPNKRKKPNRIITDLSLLSQDESEEPEELDLGIKVRTPKDIMLEELSLDKNRGSKMFKMRQIRVAKFIYENNPDLFSSESMENLQKFVPSLGGQMMDVGGHLLGTLGGAGGGPPAVPPKPGSKGGAGGAGSAGGAGGVGGAGGAAGASGGPGGQAGAAGAGAGSEWKPLKGGGGTGLHVKNYMSPWEKAMKGDEALTATLKTVMGIPDPKADLLKYKSFNRTAMPFGGYEKANQLLKFQLPDIEATKVQPEPPVFQGERGRPSFNRTPIGWVGNNEPDSSIHMETGAVPFDGVDVVDGETDEL